MKVTQSCPTLCDPMDYTVHGFLQARALEWVAFPYSRGSSQTQGLNPGLPHGRQILYHLSHKGSPLGAAFDPRVPWHTLELLSLETPTDTTGGRTQAFCRACQDVRQRKKREEGCSKAVRKLQKWRQTIHL